MGTRHPPRTPAQRARLAAAKAKLAEARDDLRCARAFHRRVCSAYSAEMVEAATRLRFEAEMEATVAAATDTAINRLIPPDSPLTIICDALHEWAKAGLLPAPAND